MCFRLRSYVVIVRPPALFPSTTFRLSMMALSILLYYRRITIMWNDTKHIR